LYLVLSGVEAGKDQNVIGEKISLAELVQPQLSVELGEQTRRLRLKALDWQGLHAKL
jgi:hypothetical protein